MSEVIQRKEVAVNVFDQERHNGGWPPESLPAFIAWLQAHLSGVPEEYRASATIEIDSESGYDGDHTARISIFYRRPETDEEYAARNQQAIRWQERQRAEELRLLEKLQAKYADKA